MIRERISSVFLRKELKYFCYPQKASLRAKFDTGEAITIVEGDKECGHLQMLKFWRG
jgi:hypothetical protein